MQMHRLTTFARACLTHRHRLWPRNAATGVLESFPPEGPAAGGTLVTLDGYGFMDTPELVVRLRTLNPPLEWVREAGDA